MLLLACGCPLFSRMGSHDAVNRGDILSCAWGLHCLIQRPVQSAACILTRRDSISVRDMEPPWQPQVNNTLLRDVAGTLEYRLAVRRRCNSQPSRHVTTVNRARRCHEGPGMIEPLSSGGSSRSYNNLAATLTVTAHAHQFVDARCW